MNTLAYVCHKADTVCSCNFTVSMHVVVPLISLGQRTNRNQKLKKICTNRRTCLCRDKLFSRTLLDKNCKQHNFNLISLNNTFSSRWQKNWLATRKDLQRNNEMEKTHFDNFSSQKILRRPSKKSTRMGFHIMYRQHFSKMKLNMNWHCSILVWKYINIDKYKVHLEVNDHLKFYWTAASCHCVWHTITKFGILMLPPTENN